MQSRLDIFSEWLHSITFNEENLEILKKIPKKTEKKQIDSEDVKRNVINKDFNEQIEIEKNREIVKLNLETKKNTINRYPH